ncbi:phage tail protein, partial [bacterium]|nr:phage tail protein [bacterium]
MPYSYAVYTGNGSTTQFTVPFPYIRKEHVKVYVNYVDTAYTYVNNTTVQLASAPANGLRVEVRRVTPAALPLVDYTDGSTLVAADLDTSNL